jgi:hypothetical protein
MHDPAACGARSAQHARVHIGAVASVSLGKMLASNPANRVIANARLAIF